MAKQFRVSFIDTPDGRVLDTTTETELGVIRAIASRLPMVGEDQLLVIEPVSVDEAIRDNVRGRLLDTLLALSPAATTEERVDAVMAVIDNGETV